MAKLYKPLADRVLLRLENEEETKSKGGIIVNSSTQQTQTARVASVSDGFLAPTGETVELSVNVDDIVLISNGSGTKIRFDGEQYILVRESDILMKK